MKGEIPVLKRCCFCAPLRYGLLVWGYFKMTADAFFITLMSYSLLQTIEMIRVYGSDNNYQNQIYQEIFVPVIALSVFLTDFVVTIVFIVGGHKKNLKLIRAFYFISIALWIFTVILTASSVFLTIQNLMLRNMDFWARAFLLTFSFHFLVVGVQSYFIILLRSEIIKLKNNGKFRFVNNAAEAECTMACEEIIAEVGAEREDV